MSTREQEASELAAADLEWFHSIELVPGIATPGRAPQSHFDDSLAGMRLPDLTGKSVLDIGAYDGFFSFAAERAGAARVVALDHYVWFTDMKGYMDDWRQSQIDGTPLVAPHESRHWQPESLPGRRPFDAAHAFLGSTVEPVVGDFMTMDLEPLGTFDVVLFLGVLYHLESPLEAMRRVRRLVAPGGLAVVETEAMTIDGLEEQSLCRFFPGRELNNDPSNWWVPNGRAFTDLGVAAGFDRATLLSEPPAPDAPDPVPAVDRARSLLDAGRSMLRTRSLPKPAPPVPRHYRATAHFHA